MTTNKYCVSYKIAEMLKDKGFNKPTWAYYHDDKIVFGDKYNWNDIGLISAPTYPSVMEWFRKNHNLIIEVRVGEFDNNFLYTFSINGKEVKCKNYDSLEESIEEAIKYCLEKLK